MQRGSTIYERDEAQGVVYLKLERERAVWMVGAPPELALQALLSSLMRLLAFQRRKLEFGHGVADYALRTRGKLRV